MALIQCRLAILEHPIRVDFEMIAPAVNVFQMLVSYKQLGMLASWRHPENASILATPWEC